MDNQKTQSLQSEDHGKLLDVIDQLRSQGISQYVHLPQIVVCGDQSSGKSSVLEAVSGVRFPTKDNLCTRFATELVLRRDTETKVDITIKPAESRSEAEKEKISGFKAPTDNLEDFSNLIDSAKSAMGLDSEGRTFSSDVLRVVISGPTQPHLTLVDLPGLFHAGSKQQSTKDRDLVETLVKKYMKSPRSVILTVVSAQSEFVNQIVTEMAREIDPKGLRTLGVITKPDTLHKGSEREADFLAIAKNEDVWFRLGWHVLRNRDYTTRTVSAEERNENESNFFFNSVWSGLPASSLGSQSLQTRLSTVLKDQILSQLPSLISDVKNGIDDCQQRLAKLGDARGSLAEQRLYLTRVSQEFSSLIQAAVDGVYSNRFFRDSNDNYKKRLRAVIVNQNLDFADEMRKKGHTFEIMEDGAEIPVAEEANKTASPTETSSQQADFGDLVHALLKEKNSGTRISRSEYLDLVHTILAQTRGRELPGTFNPLLVGELFFVQASPWPELAEAHCDRVLKATRETILEVLKFTSDDSIQQDLLRRIISPAIESLGEDLKSEISKLLLPHQHGHAITYNHYLTETVEKIQNERYQKENEKRLLRFFGVEQTLVSARVNFDIRNLLETLHPIHHSEGDMDMDKHACSLATDYMQAYYKVAMKDLIDDVARLGIEQRLMSCLADIFNPEIVLQIDDATIARIASEPAMAQNERERLTRKLESLRIGLRTLSSLETLETSSYGRAASNEAEVDHSVNTPPSISEPDPPPQSSNSCEQPEAAVEEIAAEPPRIVEAAPSPVDHVQDNNDWDLLGSSRPKKTKKGKKTYFVDEEP